MRHLGSFLITSLSLLVAAVPTPKEHFGFPVGEEKKLVNYTETVAYYQKLEKSSDRLKLVKFGTTTDGRPMYMAIISSPDNLKKIDQYKEMNRKLALGTATPEEARRLAKQSKTIVWIDAGIHSTEVAPVQHQPELGYKMLTDESDEVKRIRENVILLQVLNINPDGTDWLREWYSSNVGTPYENAPMVKLYHKYAGHDLNRDFYMMNLAETRHLTKLLFHEWFPQIVYNQHQVGPYPARIFVPPYAEPLNPNIPAVIMEGINGIGSVMKERFARENKPGALSYWGFDAWWNGGLRSVPAFHNMHGILTETAGWGYANSRTVRLSDLPDRFPNGIPTKEPSLFYPMPWMGGKWTLRDAIEYNLTADFAILDYAATRSEYFLWKAYEVARSNIETKNGAFAYAVSPTQWDGSSAKEMLSRLSIGGISIKRANAPFEVAGKKYPEGTAVMLAGQPFRGYLVDLMEPQKYPELKTGTTGPTKRPYDSAGWTLPMLMGVKVDRIEKSFEAKLEDMPAGELPLGAPSKDHRENSSFLFTADALSKGQKVRWAKDGTLLTESDAGFANAGWELSKPRVAIYEPFSTNMDAGWTDWMLDYYKIPHQMIHNEEFKKADLKSRFDTIILASQTLNSIMHGMRSGERRAGRFGGAGDEAAQQRPEYTGGLEVDGIANLQRFVKDGGTLLAFDAASELPATLFPLPVRLNLRAQEEGGGGRAEPESATAYYCPGSLLRITVDNKNPLAFGMQEDAIVYSQGGQAFDITLMNEFNKGEREIKTVASYAKKDLLASGWISGERQVLGKGIMIEAHHGKGKVVMYGFRPQFRGQSFGTFKLVLNAIYLASARAL
jgi:hypothetical protein